MKWYLFDETRRLVFQNAKKFRMTSPKIKWGKRVESQISILTIMAFIVNTNYRTSDHNATKPFDFSTP